MFKKLRSNQQGFAVLEVGIIVVVLAVIGVVAWRVYDMKQSSKQSKIISGPLTPEDRKKLQAAGQAATTLNAAEQPTTSGANTANPSTSQSQGTSGASKASTSASSPSTSTSGSSASPATTQSNNTSPTATSTPAASSSSSSSASTPAPQPTSNITRPTTSFCQQKNGDSFTNAWATDNRSHTYQVWENGGWASKTETGTAGLNYDSMQVVGVIPYLKQAAWAICSDKAGYITFYYKPTSSVYTYNWLVPFEYISVTQP